MSRTAVKESEFPHIIEVYNAEGKTSAYDLIRNQYGVKNPFFVMNRIKKCADYTYDMESDSFRVSCTEDAQGIFMDLDELCAPASRGPSAVNSTTPAVETKPAELEKLIHSLVSERLLELSRYVTLDPSAKTILIDRTSLGKDGYNIITH